MARLLAYVVNGLEEQPCDFLGRIYMLLELGDKDKEQYFTPWSVALMMAQLQFGAQLSKLKRCSETSRLSLLLNRPAVPVP